jgi:hypothetical protein
MIKEFIETTKLNGYYQGHIVHDEQVEYATNLLATAISQRDIQGVSRLGRCLRRPDDNHLHWALATLDELDARLCVELSTVCQQTKSKQSVSSQVRPNGSSIDYMRRLIHVKEREWKRLHEDFATQAQRYPDLKLTLFFISEESPGSEVIFGKPSYSINLWQYFGSGDEAKERLITSVTSGVTDYGLRQAELTGIAVIEGRETDLFKRMAIRAGSLLPDDVDKVIVSNVMDQFGKQSSSDCPRIVVTNRNPLAKWLNFILMATATSYPERFHSSTLVVDPFAASLTAFDLYL